MQTGRRRACTWIAACVLGALAPRARGATPSPWQRPLAQERAAQRTFVVTARKFAFEPARLEVRQDDLVKVTLRAEDIPHSFTIDAYRISKRAAPGQDATFEFRADRPGTFVFYCALGIDEGCRAMRGELIVHPR